MRSFAQLSEEAFLEVDAGHLSLITHPQEIADLIVNAAGRSG